MSSDKDQAGTVRGDDEQVISKQKIVIPMEKVDKVIDEQVNLNEMSGALIEITDEIDDQTNVIYVQGNNMQIKKAQSLISEIILDESDSSIIFSDKGPIVEESIADTSLSTFWIKKTLCGIVIGSKGLRIGEIQANSGAFVSIDTRNFINEKAKVFIFGNIAQIAKAKKMIEEICKKKCTHEPITHDDEYNSHIWANRTDCSLIIGLRGETVRDIQRNTNTRILVTKNENSAEDRLVIVSGMQDYNCKSALEIIKDLLIMGYYSPITKFYSGIDDESVMNYYSVTTDEGIYYYYD